MSFLDKLKQSAVSATVAASNVANTAVKQTKTAAAIGKLKLNIAQEEDKMKKAYTELGRLYYRDYETKAEPELEEYLPWIQRVSDAKVAIEDLSAQVELVKAGAQSQEADEAVEDTEDTSIYVDFGETEPVVVCVQEPQTEEVPQPEETNAAPEEPVVEPQEEPGPTIGTLYVDISGQE